MINKLFPRILNASKDSRVRGPMEMKDAYNITATSDYGDGFAAGNADYDQDGNEGVVKPAIGNAAQDLNPNYTLDNILEPGPFVRRVVGKVEDPKTGVIYFFLFSSRTQEMGVYAWDGYNYFGQGAEQWRPLYCTPEFNFSDTARVVGDIVHVSGGSDVDFRPILYFTDDENEPRKLDVLRCAELGHTPALLNNYNPNDIHDKDVITACPRSPVVPPTFEFFQEAATRASDFRRVPGVQFAYQCIYVGGEESALSTYSDIAIPDEYVRQGTITGELNLPQLCRITIDPAPYDVLTHSNEVVAYKILVRRGNDGPFYVVDEIDRAGQFGTVTTYDFYNDRVLIGITKSDEEKQFDNLPRIAQALSVVENRLFYGNYVEGYDEVPLEATVTPRYFPLGTSESSYDLVATPVVTYLGSTNSDTNPGGGIVDIQQRVAGIAIDTSTVDNILPEGTSISVIIEFEPGKNIGLYNVEGGYHNSRITGGVGPNAEYNTVPFFQQFDTSAPVNLQGGFEGPTYQSIGPDVQIPCRGFGPGVGQALEWKSTESPVGPAPSPVPVVIGTSAATPLKIAGRPVEFSVEIVTTTVIENAQAAVRVALGAALSGRPDLMPAGFSIAQSNVNPTYNYNLGLRAPDPDSEAELMNLQRLGTGALPNNSELAINVDDPNVDRDLLDMITPVFQESFADNSTPCGYIVVNEANVGMRLELQPNQTQDPHGDLILTLEVESLANTDILTAIPMLTCPDFRLRQWRFYDGDTLEQYQILDFTFDPGELLGTFGFLGGPGQITNATFFGVEGADGAFLNRARHVGYLRPAGTEQFNVEGSDIYITNNQRRDQAVLPDGIAPAQEFAFLASLGTSLFDTEGGFEFEIYEVDTAFTGYLDVESDEALLLAGFLGAIASVIIPNTALFNVGVPADADYKLVYKGEKVYEGPISSRMIMEGSLASYSGIDGGFVTYDLPFANHTNAEVAAVESQLMQSLWGPHISAYARKIKDGVFYAPREANTDAAGDPEGSVNYGGTPIPQFQILTGGLAQTQTEFFEDLTFIFDVENPEEQLQEVEVVFNGFADQLDVSGGYRSFKTSAYHDLGVVYYDDRGRPGNVNILPRVYVGGYSNEERNQPKGRVELEINLESAPPEWAHQYQIVYAGNSTYQDFIQYSVGGAFIDEVGDNSTNRNIYVSLNYLQTNDQVSYSKAFGAVDPNGNKDLYTFVPGDQIRVISYNQNDTQLSYPNQYVFDIVDQVLLTGNTDATTEEGRNPLDSGSADTPLFLQGNFLVVRDNPNAQGFSWSSVRAQGNDLQGPLSNWGRRCIVEILRPRAATDSDLRSYKETGLVFNVGRSTTGGAQGTPVGVYHQTPTIFMRNGDVWWRRIPVNLDPYVDGTFVNLIPESAEEEISPGVFEDTGIAYQPRFRNRYLEAKTFTDTFPGADVDGYGKRKFYSPESAEVRRESSITYSDFNDFSTRRVRFTSFNPYQAPFKDLPNEHGAINALVEFSEFLFVVQEDKASAVPINRNILSDASGGDQLISSDKIIGEQKFIGGKYGADNNRESVIKVQDAVYFAHKGQGEVYRFSGGKIEVVSRKGLASFLYDAFQDNIQQDNMRVVSGYDPLKDEYIISILNLDNIPYTRPSLFTQPYADPFEFNETQSGGLSGGASTGVVPDGGPTITDWDTSYGGPISDLVDEVSNTGGLPPDGVAPTGTPDDNIISTAINNRDDLIAIINGTPPDGFDPLSDPKSLNDQIATYTEGDSVELDMSAYIPGPIANLIGTVAVRALDNTSLGVYFGSSNKFFNLTLTEAQTIRDELNVASTVVPADYETFINDSNTIINQNFKGGLLVRRYEQEDVANQAIVDLKSGAESEIVNQVKTIPNLFTAIQEDLDAAGLNDNVTLTTLLGQAQSAYDALDLYLTNTLQQSESSTVTFVSSEKPDVVVEGFGAFDPSSYPLGDLQIFQLSSIVTLLDDIGENVTPLLLLENVDVSDVLSGFRQANASLRQQVDVLTSQVQNLSAAPADTTGGTFIPNVTTNQVTQTALSNYAGDDGVLTREDVITQPELTAQIQQILELYGTTTTVETGPEITDELIIAITGEIIKQLAIESGVTSDIFSITGNQSIPNKENLDLLRNLGNQLNPLDLAELGNLKDGTFGAGDLTATLSTFGFPSFFGAFPEQSGAKYGLERLFAMLDSSDPWATYLQDRENGFAGTPGSTISSDLEVNLVKAVLWRKNAQNGTSQTATTYTDLGYTHVDIPPPPFPYTSNLAFYDTAIPADLWNSVFGLDYLAAVQAAEPTNPSSGIYPWFFGQNFGKLNGGYLGVFGIPLFSRFGQNLTDTLSQAQVLSIVQNAIANNSNA